MKKSMTGLVTLAILLLVSVVVFAINSSNNHTAARSPRGAPSLCSTPVQTICYTYDEYFFPSIPAHSTVDLTVTIPGANYGDEVTVTPVDALQSGLIWVGASNPDAVVLRVANVTNSAIGPFDRKFAIVVHKY